MEQNQFDFLNDRPMMKRTPGITRIVVAALALISAPAAGEDIGFLVSGPSLGPKSTFIGDF